MGVSLWDSNLCLTAFSSMLFYFGYNRSPEFRFSLFRTSCRHPVGGRGQRRRRRLSQRPAAVQPVFQERKGKSARHVLRGKISAWRQVFFSN